MLRQIKYACFGLPLFLLGTGAANAVLIDRGGGLIYDTVLDVTWLQDTQYAITSGAATSGMSWYSATAWAEDLEFYDPVRDTIWKDWRLPTTLNAPESSGFDSSGLSSELAFMYYVNLEFAANTSLDRWDPEPTSGAYNPFTNLAYRAYWSGTSAEIPERDWAWGLHYHFGWQFMNSMADSGFAWAVRDGDVVGGSVPEPSGTVLFCLGIAAIAVRRRQSA